MKQNQQKTNIIICFTIMQMIIAEKIIDQSNDEFVAVVLFSKSSDKWKRYANRLSLKCQKLYYIRRRHIKPEYLWNLMAIRILWIKKIQREYKSCYLASIDNIYVQYLLSKIKFKNLYTFDDGTVNIAKNSIYYKPQNSSFSRKFFGAIFKVNYDILRIKMLSQCHFTIYRGMSNIIEHISYISLFDDFKVNSTLPSSKREIIHIFLGQPLDSVSKDYNIGMIEKKVSKLPIDFYFPHPIEAKTPKGIPVIQSDLIFEEYLINEIKKNPHTIYKIYSFGSSVLLNIIEVPHTKLYYIFDDILHPKFHTIYDLYDKAGIVRIE